MINGTERSRCEITGQIENEGKQGSKILNFLCDSQIISPGQLQMGGKLEGQKFGLTGFKWVPKGSANVGG